MSIIKQTVSGRSSVASWLNTVGYPDYFSTVTYSDYTVTAKNADNKVIFEWDSGGIKVHKSDSVYDTISFGTESSGDYTCVKCDGGILIMTSGTHTNFANILITKTNNGVVAVIAGGAATRVAALTTNILSAARGDAEDVTKLRSYTPSAENQTQFIMFPTYAKPDTQSYTPNAYFMNTGQYYDLSYGKFMAGGVIFITNGYWAIKDA